MPATKAENLPSYTFLIVEDNDTMREGMARVVEKLGYRAIEAGTAEQALRSSDAPTVDILISDYKLPGMNGLELLQKVRAESPDIPTLLITAYGTIELAVEAMQKGASDFITKPFSPEELSIKIKQLLGRLEERAELARVQAENQYLREQVDVAFNFGEIIGRSPAMQAVFRTISKVAPGDSSVIIYGESGTGKELVARAIHKASPRSAQAFVRVNCGALAEGVLESELFGHERGAFTGAVKRKKGRFELAQRGSIFLDEIGDIPLATQVKLLRVLQEKEFERVGGEETLHADVRVIAATNKDLQSEIKKGNFREDLYYRLHIIPLDLPPLRDRTEDIPLLKDYFLTKIGAELKRPNLRIAPEAEQALCRYHWPGNIRELENIIERAAVLCEENLIKVTDLPFTASREQAIADVDIPENQQNLNQCLEGIERQLIERAMRTAHGNKSEAARQLGIKTSALYYKLEKYDLL